VPFELQQPQRGRPNAPSVPLRLRQMACSFACLSRRNNDETEDGIWTCWNRSDGDAGNPILCRGKRAEEVIDNSVSDERAMAPLTAARIVRQGRSIAFQIAEFMVPSELFHRILEMIDSLRPPARC
jgi:hypothetical protein